MKKLLPMCNTNEVATCSITPERNSNKNDVTPLKEKSKTPKCEIGLDVHTLSSTPVTSRSRHNFSYRSPTGSLSFSQDNRPEVIWDYTSPKLPKGVRRKEINMTIDEFLKNMYRGKIPECASRGSDYLKLLEKWMATKNVTAVGNEPQEVKKKVNGKKSSRQVIEDMKNFLEAIQTEKGHTENDASLSQRKYDCNSDRNKTDTTTDSTKKILLDKKSFILGDSDFDSEDDMWDKVLETDNSFFVRATQLLESCGISPVRGGQANSTSAMISTIPETLFSPSSDKPQFSSIAGAKTDICVSDSNKNTNVSQSGEGELEKEFENWEDGFFLEDDSLSSIPEEVLQGVDSSPSESLVKSKEGIPINRNDFTQDVTNNSTDQFSLRFNEFEFFFADGLSQINEKCSLGETKRQSGEHCDNDLPSTSIHLNNDHLKQCSDNDGSLDIFNNLEDESILCKPEVLIWMDEVESQLSQNLKCTPDEIAQKKDIALKKRKKHLKNKKISGSKQMS